MHILRTSLVLVLVLGLAAPTFAQSQAAAQPSQTSPAQPTTVPAPMQSSNGKAMTYSGAAIFAGGMATALYGFIRVGNGEFSTFGEATSRNKPLGAAGLAAAFAGGTLMFLGKRAQRYTPSTVAVSGERVSVEKTFSW